MGTQREDQDYDHRRGRRIKVTLAGRLTGSVDGQLIQLHAHDQTLTLELASLPAAWRLRGNWTTVRSVLGPAVEHSRVRLDCKVPGLPRFEIAPDPPWWVRLVLPG